MASHLQATLVSDGTSDRALIPLLEWLIDYLRPDLASSVVYADLGRLRTPPTYLHDRISVALDLFPADLIFVHRDAEGVQHAIRKAEIESAVKRTQSDFSCVPVVPIRMTEAWLLTDAYAIRRAAGNPNGTVPLKMPVVREIESIPDPKQRLKELIRQAADLNNRRSSTAQQTAVVDLDGRCWAHQVFRRA